MHVMNRNCSSTLLTPLKVISQIHNHTVAHTHTHTNNTPTQGKQSDAPRTESIYEVIVQSEGGDEKSQMYYR